MAPDVAFGSMAEKNEFTKYSKFLAYKVVQVIVESRTGDKIEVNSKSRTSESQWFNLLIPDDAEVNKTTKMALPSDKVLETFEKSLNIEISVKTEEGDEMGLEIWTLGLDTKQRDPKITSLPEIYDRMTKLLKSLIITTRITPAYHVSRRQRIESFTIFYKVYSGEINKKTLGDSYLEKNVATIHTYRGGIYLKLMHRTDLSISPNKPITDSGLLLKSDHFEMSPKHLIVETSNIDVIDKPKQVTDINKPLRLAAFVDEMLIKKVFEEFSLKYPIPKCPVRCEKDIHEIENELQDMTDVDSGVVTKTSTVEIQSKKNPTLNSETDPPLKLLYFPFADQHPIRELAEFYKEFFNAPHLRLTDDFNTKSIEQGLQDCQLDDAPQEEGDYLSKDLDLYESSVQEFDDLLADMCRSTEWTGS